MDLVVSMVKRQREANPAEQQQMHFFFLSKEGKIADKKGRIAAYGFRLQCLARGEAMEGRLQVQVTSKSPTSSPVRV